MNIIQVREEALARDCEQFLVKALSPGGFAYIEMDLGTLKDKLAWVSYANLMRKEQPTFAAMDGDKVVGILVGEPVEDYFDIGEAEIQDIYCLENYKSKELFQELMINALEFYKKAGAKQIHVWSLKSLYESNELNLKCETASRLGFKFKGFERVSKWTGKRIVKLELDPREYENSESTDVK